MKKITNTILTCLISANISAQPPARISVFEYYKTPTSQANFNERIRNAISINIKKINGTNKNINTDKRTAENIEDACKQEHEDANLKPMYFTCCFFNPKLNIQYKRYDVQVHFRSQDNRDLTIFNIKIPCLDTANTDAIEKYIKKEFDNNKMSSYFEDEQAAFTRKLDEIIKYEIFDEISGNKTSLINEPEFMAMSDKEKCIYYEHKIALYEYFMNKSLEAETCTSLEFAKKLNNALHIMAKEYYYLLSKYATNEASEFKKIFSQTKLDTKEFEELITQKCNK